MSRSLLPHPNSYALAWLALIAMLVVTPITEAGVVELKNGLQLEGKLGKIGEIGEDPTNPRVTGPVRVTKVVIVDDNLTRVFVSSNQVVNIAESEFRPKERINIRQRVATKGKRVAGVGPIVRIQPWDPWGRRTFSFMLPTGKVDVIQGITQITPTYCKVEGLLGRNSYVWDMRVATSSIPRATLSKVLMRQIDETNSAERLKIVNLYIQAQRDRDALAELTGVIKDFPELKALKVQVQTLRQLGARRLIREIELRRDAGQHRRAYSMLQKFPADGVAGAILLQVRDLLGEYEELKKNYDKSLALIDEYMGEVKDEATKAKLEPVQTEIKSQLNINTLDRMADFLRLSEDDTLNAKQKLALATSAWLLGSGSGTENLAVALDTYEVRNLVRKYLQTIHVHERDAILKEMETLEGADPASIDKIVKHMRPAIEEQLEPGDIPGMYEISIPGFTGEPDFEYLIQIPPEYDPSRPYPCVVTLNGAGTTPAKQIDWWAGTHNKDLNERLGQATRQGYIVMAPKWSTAHQGKYKYSAREHAVVLKTLRDACRRFSIDTDRVFLSGHSMGGDAAWDIGLAHPDLWAGIIPIVATADKYISRYHVNGRYHLPMYFVTGELDGDRMERNKMDLNRYLRNHGYDTMVVQYLGRGHEHFHDEIQRIFEWMELHRREFFPKEFNVVAMRPWDNYFWWAELNEYPEKSMVMPLEWPRKGAREALTEGSVLDGNTVRLESAARKQTIWLSPEMVDFTKIVRIVASRKTRRVEIQPSVKTLLEDVRTRGDRQHAFWAKYDVP